MNEAIRRVIAAVPLRFWLLFEEEANAAFHQAHKSTSDLIEEPEKKNMLGQLRHALSEKGMRSAAEQCGISFAAPHTNPMGGRYTVLTADGVVLTRSNVMTSSRMPKASRFRKGFAKLNGWLKPRQMDLLDADEVAEGGLYLIIVTMSGKRSLDRTVPDAICVGIPNQDFSGWIAVMPLSTLIAMYHDGTGGGSLDGTDGGALESAPEVKVRDAALPRLKKDVSKDSSD